MRTDKTAGVILREVKQHLSDDIYRLGVKAMNSSVEDKKSFLSSVQPYLNKVELLKQDRATFKKFNSLPKTIERINFLNSYRGEEEMNPNPRDARPNPRSARPNPRDARPSPRDARPNPRDARPNPRDARLNPRGANPRDAGLNPRGAGARDARPNPRDAGARDAGARDARPNLNRVLEKAKSVKKEVDKLEKEHKEEKKINALEAYRVAKSKKFNDIKQYSLTVYTETEELVTQREIKYLKAKEDVVELEKQIKLIQEDIKYYKFGNIQPDIVSSLEKGLNVKLKALGSAKKDVKHFAPKTKKFLNYVGGALVAPIKLVTGLFVTPKPVELTAEQIIKLGVR